LTLAPYHRFAMPASPHYKRYSLVRWTQREWQI